MYGFEKDKRCNDNSFEDHSYLFSNTDGILSNTALLTPDPENRFLKLSNSNYRDFEDLGNFHSHPNSDTKPTQIGNDPMSIDSGNINSQSNRKEPTGMSNTPKVKDE